MPKIRLETETVKNEDYRKVIFTGKNLQLVLMSLKPGEEIGKEMHDHVDQFFRIEEGQANFLIGTNSQATFKLQNGDAFVVPAGTYHNVINTGRTELKIYTIYSPPNHLSDCIQAEKPKETDPSCD